MACPTTNGSKESKLLNTGVGEIPGNCSQIAVRSAGWMTWLPETNQSVVFVTLLNACCHAGCSWPLPSASGVRLKLTPQLPEGMPGTLWKYSENWQSPEFPEVARSHSCPVRRFAGLERHWKAMLENAVVIQLRRSRLHSRQIQSRYALPCGTTSPDS